VKLSPEQRLTRDGVIRAIGRLLRDFWKKQLEARVPDHITQLLARLHDREAPPSASGGSEKADDAATDGHGT
jgi:hypothetical protein